jgi:serine/threonine protein kinase
MQHEWAIIQRLPDFIALAGPQLVTQAQSIALVSEDVGFRPLDFRSQPELRDALQVPAELTAAVRALHDMGLVHNAIEPRNVWVRQASNEVRLTGFEACTELGSELSTLCAPAAVPGNLQFISPEQTGRVNWVIDSRSDLYSVGVVIFALVSGRPPFETADALKRLHAHLAAGPPLLPAEVAPPPVAAMVEHLLHKAPEQRYQSAHGLHHDLQRILRQLDSEGRIDALDIAASDYSYRLRLAAKLYGREAQIDELHKAFDRTCESSELS